MKANLKNGILIGGITLASAVSSQAALTLVSDDFGSSSITSGARFTSNDIDTGNWDVRANAGPAWSVSGGQLINPALVTDDDKGAHLLNTVSSTDTTLTQVAVSFDYTVGIGSILFLHSHLLTGTNTVTGNMARTTATAGATFAQDFVPDFPTGVNLKDGAAITGAASEALTSFAGATSGTFSQTYDISGYTGIASIADVGGILAIFTVDSAAAGDGAITVDNLSITASIPEPSSTALLGLGSLALLVRRRK